MHDLSVGVGDALIQIAATVIQAHWRGFHQMQTMVRQQRAAAYIQVRLFPLLVQRWVGFNITWTDHSHYSRLSHQPQANNDLINKANPTTGVGPIRL